MYSFTEKKLFRNQFGIFDLNVFKIIRIEGGNQIVGYEYSGESWAIYEINREFYKDETEIEAEKYLAVLLDIMTRE